MPLLDHTEIERLVDLAAARLDGEWLLIGGAAAAAWFRADRVTEDLDLIGLRGGNEERFALMELAQEAGHPVDIVNSAADFFVRKIADWRDQLVPLRRARATIYRPTATLFLLLKITRLSEVDLEDCERLIAHCRGSDEPLDAPRVLRQLAALPATDDALLATRREALSRALDGS